MKENASIVATVLKRISPGTLLLLAVTLAANAFAWFIYTTKVDSGITAHVRAWDISFVVGDTPLSQVINFDVEDIYPGMTTYTDSIIATNRGESSATFSYEIVSATILGTVYTVDENLSSDELLFSLANDYPFIISFSASTDNISPNGGQSEFVVNVSWAYESGDDVLDTSWGNRAYHYYENNPVESAISLTMKISAMQTPDEEISSQQP